MKLPRMLPVRQDFPDRRLENIEHEVTRELAGSGLAERLKPGSRIAIGVGSRGIANIDTIARSVAAFWKSCGMRPFIIPVMGSHGAATAAGQADVLAHYGITEQTMGCPIVSSLDVVSLGKTPAGIETFIDKQAYESDGVMLVSRIKWHTDFEAPIESGLFKMMAIGLGKLAGAQRYHTHAYNMGLLSMIHSVGRQVLQSGRILGGLAILEDAYHQTAQLTAVCAEDFERREKELLALVKSWKGRILLDEIDVLIVDEIGKNISGAGMDTKIVNRGSNGRYNPWPNAPKIQRIFVRDLSPFTYGNAIGFGLADVVTTRLVEGIDWESTRVNALTASALAAVRTPLHSRSDRECIHVLAQAVGKLNTEDVTFAWIRNSLELGQLVVSENLLPKIEAHPQMEVTGPASEFEFDAEGNLADRLPKTIGAAATVPSLS
ncbi:MAG: hypothetical protein ACRD7E_32160 [Bryobacteraceae bacterium]